MLLNELTEFCDNMYSTTRCDDSHCTHPTRCPQSCETCLKQVHFPSQYSGGRLDYNCNRILYYYVCRYTYKYESEIEYAFELLPQLQNFDEFDILSLGCGASPDYIALEQFADVNNLQVPITYRGVDMNQHWEPIHNMIKDYATRNSDDIEFIYDDVTKLFKHTSYKKCNMLIIQYLISFFYNNEDILTISEFYDDLIEGVIKYMPSKSAIIINDVNSKRRGRDYFMMLSEKLTEKGIPNTPHMRCFDYGIQSDNMCYGNVYDSVAIKHPLPPHVMNYNPWEICSSAQLIIELE